MPRLKRCKPAESIKETPFFTVQTWWTGQTQQGGGATSEVMDPRAGEPEALRDVTGDKFSIYAEAPAGGWSLLGSVAQAGAIYGGPCPDGGAICTDPPHCDATSLMTIGFASLPQQVTKLRIRGESFYTSTAGAATRVAGQMVIAGVYPPGCVL